MAFYCMGFYGCEHQRGLGVAFAGTDHQAAASRMALNLQDD
jgi:hypothetical protein